MTPGIIDLGSGTSSWGLQCVDWEFEMSFEPRHIIPSHRNTEALALAWDIETAHTDSDFQFPFIHNDI